MHELSEDQKWMETLPAFPPLQLSWSLGLEMPHPENTGHHRVCVFRPSRAATVAITFVVCVLTDRL